MFHVQHQGERCMQVLVNDVRLFFDVEGASLVPDGRTMREKPTLVLLHGGPGFDHSYVTGTGPPGRGDRAAGGC